MSGLAIDLSRLPPPDIIEELDVDALFAERIAELRAALIEETGSDEPWNAVLRADPLVKDQTINAYRELLVRNRVNEAVRAVLAATARGSDLDAIAVRANVSRLQIGSDDNDQPIMESDDALRLRYLLSFAAPSAGSRKGYEGRVRAAHPGVHAVAIDTERGTGEVTILLADPAGAVTPQADVDRVRAALAGDDARPLTDHVTVAATILPYVVEAELIIPAGPDPSAIRTAAETAVRATIAERYRIGAAVPAGAILSACYVPNVARVTLASPVADVAVGEDEAPWCESVTITTKVAP